MKTTSGYDTKTVEVSFDDGSSYEGDVEFRWHERVPSDQWGIDPPVAAHAEILNIDIGTCPHEKHVVWAAVEEQCMDELTLDEKD